MKHRTNRRAKRALVAGVVGAATLASLAIGTAHAAPPVGHDFGFTPITTNALSCAATGYPVFANDKNNHPSTPVKLVQAGDPATPVHAPATSNKVGTENDMIALSPDEKYLFTPSEAGASDGITRLGLRGKDAGQAVLLAANIDGAGNHWSRIDGMKWYPYGGPNGDGTLLAGEEFATGGIWQVNPVTGDFVRLSWLGDYAHEGIGLDNAGNLYLGDENRTGAIYKAVPNDTRDLTLGGTLYYLVGTGVDANGWKQVTNPSNATAEASAGGAVLFDRPEDFDEANDHVYFTVTEPAGDSDTRHGAVGQIVNRGGVYSLSTTGVPNLAAASGALPYSKLTPMIEVNDPVYPNAAAAQAQQGLQFPDNIAFDGRGQLWVHEDIPDGTTFPASGVDVSKQVRDQQDELFAYVLDASGEHIIPNPSASGPGVSGGYKAADMRSEQPTHACENEFTGGIFGRDGKTLYINQQHIDNPTLSVKFG